MVGARVAPQGCWPLQALSPAHIKLCKRRSPIQAARGSQGGRHFLMHFTCSSGKWLPGRPRGWGWGCGQNPGHKDPKGPASGSPLRSWWLPCQGFTPRILGWFLGLPEGYPAAFTSSGDAGLPGLLLGQSWEEVARATQSLILPGNRKPREMWVQEARRCLVTWPMAD